MKPLSFDPDSLAPFGAVYHGGGSKPYRFTVSNRVDEVSGAVFVHLLDLGWEGTATLSHEKSRALGIVWWVCTVAMKRNGKSLTLRLVEHLKDAKPAFYSCPDSL